MTIMISKKEKLKASLLILMVMPLVGGGLDIYAPSLLNIRHYFATTDSQIQLSITAYLVGYAVGTLVIGMIADYLSYHSITVYCSLIFTISCFLSILSPSVTFFIVQRLIQGLAAAGPSITAKGYLGKLFSGHELLKKSANVGLSWSLGLVFAPVIGGYLAHYFGWKSSFLVLGIYSLIITILACSLNYQNPKKPLSMLAQHLAKDLKKILTNRIMIGASLSGAMIYAIIAVFNSLGPFILQGHLSLSPKDYGHVGLVIGLCWLLGSTLNKYLVKRFKATHIYKTVLIIYFLITVITLLCYHHLTFNIINTMIPVACIYFIGGILLTYGIFFSLTSFPGLEGLVTAIRAFLTIAITALLSLICAYVPSINAFYLIAIYTGMSFFALICSYIFFD